MKKQSEYFSIPQAARIRKCTQGCIHHWIRSGLLPAERFAGGRYWMIRSADLAAVPMQKLGRPLKYKKIAVG